MTPGGEPQGAGRHLVDSAQRGSLARLAQRAPLSVDVLEAAAGWEEQGLWPRMWRTFLAELNERQQLNWSESFMDGSFAPAKKGAAAVGKTKRGKGTMWMVVVEGGGVPLGVRPYSASPAEVRLAEETLADHPRRAAAPRCPDSPPSAAAGSHSSIRTRGNFGFCPRRFAGFSTAALDVRPAGFRAACQDSRASPDGEV